MKKMSLDQFERLIFAIEVDHKPKRGGHIMTSDEISDFPKYKNDMKFEITLPNGNVERKYITQKRLKEIGVVRFVVRKEVI